MGQESVVKGQWSRVTGQRSRVTGQSQGSVVTGQLSLIKRLSIIIPYTNELALKWGSQNQLRTKLVSYGKTLNYSI